MALDPKTERRLALERGLLADFGDRDREGRIRLHHGSSLMAGDRLFLCAEDGALEREVVVESGPDKSRVGRLTGKTRACVVEQD